MNNIIRCKNCGASCFWLQDDDGKWLLFEDDVVMIDKPGRTYATGTDEIKKSTEQDKIKGIKGFWRHFCR